MDGWRNGGGVGGERVPSVVLTIRLRVAVHQRWHADEDLIAVPLHHQLQLAAGLLDQFPCVVQRQVLCDCSINLQTGGARSETEGQTY